VIEDFSASDRPPWRLIAQESLALVATGLLFPFGLGAQRRRTQLRPDSALVARLSARDRSVRFLSVVAGSDSLVVPRVFATHDEIVRVPDLGHSGLLFSPLVYRIVARRLLPAG
jgi:hypothetical protein